jgi:hypothetical protein
MNVYLTSMPNIYEYYMNYSTFEKINDQYLLCEDMHVCTHACTHARARARAHTHTQGEFKYNVAFLYKSLLITYLFQKVILILLHITSSPLYTIAIAQTASIHTFKKSLCLLIPMHFLQFPVVTVAACSHMLSWRRLTLLTD